MKTKFGGFAEGLGGDEGGMGEYGFGREGREGRCWILIGSVGMSFMLDCLWSVHVTELDCSGEQGI